MPDIMLMWVAVAATFGASFLTVAALLWPRDSQHTETVATRLAYLRRS